MDVEYLIEGERAALGPLRRDLAETYVAWINRVRPLRPNAGRDLRAHRHQPPPPPREVFGLLLGERRGEGIGTEATRLTLDWAFNVLSLLNVLLEVCPWNAGAIRAYEKAGFTLIGRRREALLHHGRRWDEIYMDAVASEFGASGLASRLPALDHPG